MNRLAGKVAVITGGAGGIGRASAERMAHEGARVVLADVSAEHAEAAASEIRSQGGEALGIGCDVSARADVEAVFSAAASAMDTPTILVCTAGITSAGSPTTFLEVSDTEWNRVLEVNLRGTFLCGQIAARHMVAAGLGGSIITFASIGGERPMYGSPAYHTSKAAVSGLTRAMAVNLAHQGIRANVIAPGYIMTDMMRSVLGEPEMFAAIVKRVPSARFGEPDEVAAAVAFLASDESEYINGETLHIDGGAFVLGWTDAQAGQSWRRQGGGNVDV